ncbi:MAG: hypothetical protein AAF950_04985 [Pseudomonadota bacterium]
MRQTANQQRLEERIRTYVRSQPERNATALKSVRRRISGFEGPMRDHPTPPNWPPQDMAALEPKKVGFFHACWILLLASAGLVAQTGSGS